MPLGQGSHTATGLFGIAVLTATCLAPTLPNSCQDDVNSPADPQDPQPFALSFTDTENCSDPLRSLQPPKSPPLNHDTWLNDLTSNELRNLREAFLLLKKRGAEFDPLPLLSDTFDFAAKAPFVNSGDRISELLKAGLTPEALASFVVYLQALKEREELHKLIAVNIHGKTLIGQLCELAAIKNTGIDASEAITALLLQLTVPSSAEQGNAGTCGVMGPLGLISILEPGNVAGLFIRECYRNGATIDEESGEVRLDQNLSIHLHERTPFNAALQTTLINEAALGGTYKSDIDRIFVNGPDQTLIEHGVRTEWIAQLLTEQLKIPYEADFRPDPAALLERLTKCKNLGIAVLSWPQRFNQSEKTSYAAHAVWILDVTTDGVLFYNSQGPSPLEIPKGYRNGPDGNKSLGFNLYEMDLKSFGYNLLGIVAPKEGIDISGYKNRVDSGLACGLRLYDLLRNVEK